MHMKTFLHILKKILNEKYPSVVFDFYFYSSKKCSHGIRPQSINIAWSRWNICDIKEIWLEKKQDTNFKFVLPQLIHTTKWKFNYIIFRKNFDNFDFLKNVYWI